MQKKYKLQIVNNEGDSVTLDAKHDEILSSIEDQENELPALKKRLERMRSEVDADGQYERDDEIRSIKERIRSIKRRRKDYYLENSKYIFKYFERKQSIANAEPLEAENKSRQNYLLKNFFKISNEAASEQNTLNESGSAGADPNLKEASSDAPKGWDDPNAENEEMQRYLLNINEMNRNLYHYVTPNDVCGNCHKGEMVMYDSDGILICTNCSQITRYIIEHEKPSYREPPKEVCFYAYKRINHFREILAQFQAKESTQIPEKVLEDFKMQIRKERISLSNLTNKKAKEILKKLNHSKYYEHVPFIKDKIGIKPPVMDNTLEETLCNLFLEIQAPYAKYCPDSRVNFLNYYYTIYKLCELLDKRQFLEYFPMLKDKSKRIEQDNIWKNICKELNWRFIPTV